MCGDHGRVQVAARLPESRPSPGPQDKGPSDVHPIPSPREDSPGKTRLLCAQVSLLFHTRLQQT